MRYPTAVAVAAALCGLAFSALTALAVEPGEGEPGRFKVLFENDEIRIIKASTPPGETEGWHSHPRYFAYVASGSKMHYDNKDGSSRDIDIPTGANRMLEPVEWHRGTNIGDTTFTALLIEFKK